MAYVLAPNLKFREFDKNGNPLKGGLLYTYIAGTEDDADTFTDATGDTKNSNPIILSDRGDCDLWLSTNLTYKFVLKDANDKTIYTVDNVVGGGSGGGSGAQTYQVRVSLEDNTPQFLSEKLIDTNDVSWSVVDVTGVKKLQINTDKLQSARGFKYIYKGLSTFDTPIIPNAGQAVLLSTSNYTLQVNIATADGENISNIINSYTSLSKIIIQNKKSSKHIIYPISSISQSGNLLTFNPVSQAFISSTFDVDSEIFIELDTAAKTYPAQGTSLSYQYKANSGGDFNGTSDMTKNVTDNYSNIVNTSIDYKYQVRDFNQMVKGLRDVFACEVIELGATIIDDTTEGTFTYAQTSPPIFTSNDKYNNVLSIQRNKRFSNDGIGQNWMFDCVVSFEGTVDGITLDSDVYIKYLRCKENVVFYGTGKLYYEQYISGNDSVPGNLPVTVTGQIEKKRWLKPLPISSQVGNALTRGTDGLPYVATSVTPTNYITTNTNQTGLTGNKTTAGQWTFTDATAGVTTSYVNGRSNSLILRNNTSNDNYLSLGASSLNLRNSTSSMELQFGSNSWQLGSYNANYGYVKSDADGGLRFRDANGIYGFDVLPTTTGTITHLLGVTSGFNIIRKSLTDLGVPPLLNQHQMYARTSGGTGVAQALSIGANAVVARNGGNIVSLDAGTNTVLTRGTGNTLAFLSIGASQVLGRGASGDITALNITSLYPSDYVTLGTAQTITGSKTFTANQLFSGEIRGGVGSILKLRADGTNGLQLLNLNSDNTKDFLLSRDSSTGEIFVRTVGSLSIPTTLAQHQVYGRTSAGTGTPQAITIGTNQVLGRLGSNLQAIDISALVGATPNLQQVTNVGNTTTNNILVLAGAGLAPLIGVALASDTTKNAFIQYDAFEDEGIVGYNNLTYLSFKTDKTRVTRGNFIVGADPTRTERLQVNGTAWFGNTLFVDNTSSSVSEFNINNKTTRAFFTSFNDGSAGDSALGTSSNHLLALRTNNLNRGFIKNTGQWVIGSGIPSGRTELLQVDGTSWFGSTIQIAGGSPANGKYLVSDANGLASWQNLTIAPSTPIQTGLSNGNIYACTGAGTLKSANTYIVRLFPSAGGKFNKLRLFATNTTGVGSGYQFAIGKVTSTGTITRLGWVKRTTPFGAGEHILTLSATAEISAGDDVFLIVHLSSGGAGSGILAYTPDDTLSNSAARVIGMDSDTDVLLPENTSSWQIADFTSAFTSGARVPWVEFIFQ